MLERPVDLLSTTVAICLEVESAEDALRPLDEHMVKLARRLNQLAEGAFLIDIGERPWKPGEPREIDISAATSWFTGGLPIMKNIRLNWTVANGPYGAWYVIATHRRHLECVVEALEKEPAGEPILGKFDNVGTADGGRIGKHLASWSNPAEWAGLLEDGEELRATMQLMSEFASGFKRCRWRMSRPSRDEMLLDMQLILSPPHSADR